MSMTHVDVVTCWLGYIIGQPGNLDAIHHLPVLSAWKMHFNASQWTGPRLSKNFDSTREDLSQQSYLLRLRHTHYKDRESDEQMRRWRISQVVPEMSEGGAHDLLYRQALCIHRSGAPSYSQKQGAFSCIHRSGVLPTHSDRF
jgi:hypothetical protein